MVDAVVTTILQQLTTVIYEQASQKVQLVAGFKSAVEKLTSNFQAIQAVLQDAERRQAKDKAVKDWLHKLKHVSYDMEDVLDEWKTALLTRQQRDHENHNQVCSFQLRLPFSSINQVCLRRDLAHKIKQLSDRLDVIAEEKQRFHFVHERAIVEDRPRTTSVIDAAKVYGREHDQASVKNMILTGNDEGLRVFSIVGMSGIGKTTLAQLVYNDGEIKTCFDKTIWICVSDTFDETRIAKEILEAFRGERPNVDGMDIVLQQIREHVSGSKVLLVLDDVWTEESSKWEQLMNTMKCAISGSGILVTTRNKGVAMAMKCAISGSILNEEDSRSRRADLLDLSTLNEEDSWSLFTQLAFLDRTRDEREMLEGIGREIVEKCEGLPLAIKIIGCHLRSKSTRKEWQHVLASETWEIKDATGSLFGPLLLSYYDLPPPSKRCFSYSAFFPKDNVFIKGDLMKLWMAEGFLGKEKEMDIVAEDCFNNLAAWCFFQDFTRGHNGNIHKFKMHDIVHDFAMFLSGDECYLIDDSDVMKDVPREGTRHIFMNVEDQERLQLPHNFFRCKKLRSVHFKGRFYGETEANPFALDWGQFISLRTLQLRRLQFKELPKKIGKLKHLRYLGLADNSLLKTLPEGICDLCNMQTLNTTCCSSLETLPQRIGDLSNLWYLDNWETERLESMPKGMGRLSNLREIGNFAVSGRKKDAGLEELGNLLKLERVWITGLGNIRDVKEGRKAKLEEKSALLHLALKFNVKINIGEVMNDKQEQLLEVLRPPPCLQSLCIIQYSGRPRLPSWMMSLNNLTSVALLDCGEMEQLLPLGKLLRLETLFLQKMSKVKKVGGEFLGISPSEQSVVFPNLRQLHFYFMSEWEEWEWNEEEYSSLTIMPCLHSLQIKFCPKLKSIPQQILGKATLQELIIYDSPIVEARCSAKTGED